MLLITGRVLDRRTLPSPPRAAAGPARRQESQAAGPCLRPAPPSGSPCADSILPMDNAVTIKLADGSWIPARHAAVPRPAGPLVRAPALESRAAARRVVRIRSGAHPQHELAAARLTWCLDAVAGHAGLRLARAAQEDFRRRGRRNGCSENHGTASRCIPRTNRACDLRRRPILARGTGRNPSGLTGTVRHRPHAARSV